MLRWLVAVVFALAALPAAARSVTDSAGRVVEVPDTVRTVFAAGPPASILVYVVAPEALTGWPRALRDEERPYIAAPYRDLPETGRLTGRGGEANLERVLALRPDVIIDFGSVRDTYIDLANRVQAQTGIPYLLVDGRFEATPHALRLIGEVLGVPERGETLARDAENTFARIDAILAGVPESARPRAYLARGAEGLETGLKGSINTEILERAGARNVADPGDGRRGLVQASIEQVIVADPEVIVTWDRNFYDRVWRDPLWGGIAAVRTGRVYLAPTAPFGWIDRPPSLNRLMGLRWLAGLFYPERWTGDLREEARAFYKHYYHVDLDEADLDRLLEWSKGRAP
ncbi:iron ABC transporter substrate-binding protein [Limibaculum sp. M0105]|uniref:Iron ABC transporter substrate-binding protein n=1 Tax=Thermohalobaculum xanthum TaxID=2753746 RepID=A0A8J7M8A6_9RHOB|nr:iron ABC transporter substrate-binding protein [Thermohalobaculum xanthum]MBK0400429.1 iron ABC transporter substrate-binding protein [Thermohalobaculum xanthum]